MKPPPDPHYRHRFPAEIISHAVWLYHVFSLSLRDVELLLAERGVVVSYESIRQWCKVRPDIREPPATPPDHGRETKWHMDEVFIRIVACSTIFGVPPWIRTALHARHPRSTTAGHKAAKRFFRRLLKSVQSVPH